MQDKQTKLAAWRKLPYGIFALLILLCASCARRPGQVSAHAQQRAVIQNIGSDTMVNLAQAWAEEYAQAAPAVSVEVSGGGTGTGVAALISGTADLANCSRQLESTEAEQVKAVTGQEPHEHIVGYDALAIFVHRDNPLEEITLAQLAAIYAETGPVKWWTDMSVKIPGCRSNEMILVSRQSNSGTYHYFREAILGKTGDFKLGTLDLHGSKDVVELVGRTPCAIGYSGMGYATSQVKMLRVARQAGQPAFPPTVEHTQNSSYPIARPLYMYTRGTPSEAVNAYLRWIQGAAGQEIVLVTGYVPRAKTVGLRAANQPGK
jgi:phosphate transport system substrate-binding protein